MKRNQKCVSDCSWEKRKQKQKTTMKTRPNANFSSNQMIHHVIFSCLICSELVSAYAEIGKKIGVHHLWTNE